MINNVLIDLNGANFHFSCGGITVQFELCRILCDFGVNSKIRSSNCQINNVCNNYYNNDFPIDETCLVIYGETIKGNPLNAKNVARWILAPIGMCSEKDITDTWEKSDIVYYFNSEKKFADNPEKIGDIYKLLSVLYLNPNIKKYNLNERKNVCFTIRKYNEIHKKNFNQVHPHNSFEITRAHTQDNYIKIFNDHKWFMCYDPLTFLIIISALCGCIPVVLKVEGMDKQQWIQTTAAAEYLKYKGLDNLYGIAYGREDMQYASDTLHLVKDQWDDIINYCKEKTIIPFINDIQNFENLKNTIQNNYYS